MRLETSGLEATFNPLNLLDSPELAGIQVYIAPPQAPQLAASQTGADSEDHQGFIAFALEGIEDSVERLGLHGLYRVWAGLRHVNHGGYIPRHEPPPDRLVERPP